MDRSLLKDDCEMCHSRLWLTQLLRLQFTHADYRTMVFDEILCGSCRDQVIAFYWKADPTLLRWFHPA